LSSSQPQLNTPEPANQDRGKLELNFAGQWPSRSGFVSFSAGNFQADVGATLAGQRPSRTEFDTCGLWDFYACFIVYQGTIKTLITQ